MHDIEGRSWQPRSERSLGKLPSAWQDPYRLQVVQSGQSPSPISQRAQSTHWLSTKIDSWYKKNMLHWSRQQVAIGQLPYYHGGAMSPSRQEYCLPPRQHVPRFGLLLTIYCSRHKLFIAVPTVFLLPNSYWLPTRQSTE
jgi:hypothetical protein